MSSNVTREEIERVAELAHLNLTPEETGSMVHDLNAILDHIAQLEQLDTSKVEPLAQVSELNGAGEPRSLREDVIRPSLDRAEVMSQSPDSSGSFFKVPKVIER